MKKISLLGLGMLTAFAASAQADVVKNVEHMLKGSNPDNAKALNEIQPALTNPETSGTMMPWYLAGKAAFGIFDDVYTQESIGQNTTPEQKKQGGVAYVDGYNYYLTALQLDSIPDAKGKVKPKKSKEILNTLKGSHPYMRTAAVFLMQAGDYDDAYNAWEIFVTAPNDPRLRQYAPEALADTMLGESLFWQAQNMLASDEMSPDSAKVEKAMAKLQQVLQTGYQEPNVYVYGVLAANRLGNDAAGEMFAKEGFAKYGTSEITLVGELINQALNKQDYATAMNLADEAVAATAPENAKLLAQLYTIKGQINERDGKYPAADGDYRKALSYDGENVDAMNRLAQVILIQVDEQTNANPNLQTSDFKDQVLEAAGLLEKLYNLDDVKYSHLADTLWRIYYNLGKDYIEQTNTWDQLRQL